MARSKNSMLKTRPKHDPYEIWVLGDWEWHVLKKYQADDRKYGARWFALVKTPYAPDGEMGDVWVRHVVAAGAVKKLTDGERFVGEEIQALMADGYTKAQATEMMKDKRYNPYGKKVRRNPRSTGYVAAKIRANTARRNSGSLPRNKIYAPPNVVRQGDIRSDLIHDDRRAATAAAQVLLVRMRSAWLWYDDLDIELEDGYLTTSQVPSMEKRLVEADLKRYFPDLTDFDLKRVLSQVKGWGSVQPRDKMDKLARAAVKIRAK